MAPSLSPARSDPSSRATFGAGEISSSGTASADGVSATAPMDGVLHPVNTLDTLGIDEKESPCKRP